MSGQAVQEALVTAYHGGLQVLAHCNRGCGGGAVFAGRGRGRAGISRFPRPAAGHDPCAASCLDQMEAVKRTGVLPSFFVAHVYRWGEVHIRNFGLARAQHISPARAALRRAGIPFIPFHRTRPCCRRTCWYRLVRGQPVMESGAVLGADQRIPVEDALRAVTVHAAYQYF